MCEARLRARTVFIDARHEVRDSCARLLHAPQNRRCSWCVILQNRTDLWLARSVSAATKFLRPCIPSHFGCVEPCRFSTPFAYLRRGRSRLESSTVSAVLTHMCAMETGLNPRQRQASATGRNCASVSLHLNVLRGHAENRRSLYQVSGHLHILRVGVHARCCTKELPIPHIQSSLVFYVIACIHTGAVRLVFFRAQASGGFCRGWMTPHRTARLQRLGGWLPSSPATCACILRREAFRWCKMASCSMLRRLCWCFRRPPKRPRSKSLLVLVRLAHGLAVLWWRWQTLSIPCWLRYLS